MRGKKLIFSIFTLILMFGLWTGCGKKEGLNPVQETTGTVFIDTLYASSDTLQAGDTLLITARVVDEDNLPRQGETVNFTTSYGTISPGSATSDSQGGVWTNLIAQADTADHLARVTATVTSSGDSMGLTIPVKGRREVTPGAPFNISLKITPTSPLLANGADTATVVATVTDIQGQPVPDGTPVTFVAGEKFVDINGDGSFTSGVDSLVIDANGDGEWNAVGSIPSTATTSGGQATVHYISGTSPQAVYIKATAGAAQSDGVITLKPLRQIWGIDIGVDRSFIQVKGTGGNEVCEITATGLDIFNNPVPQGLEISFRILQGPAGGESLEDSGYGPITKLTDSGGQAKVHLHSGTLSGTVQIEAFSDGVYSQATQVTICSGPPYVISLSADPLNIRGWDIDDVPSNVLAIVSDRFGNPVPDGTAVYFSTEEGQVETKNSVTTNGKTEVTYISSTDPWDDGIAWVVGSTRTTDPQTRTIKDSVGIIVSGPPVTINFIGYPPSLEADGKDKGKIFVEVLDVNGHYVVGGTEVKFETTQGTISGSATTEDGVHASIAEAEITSEILDKDYSLTTPDDGIGAVAAVTARSGLLGGASATVNINFRTTSASSENSSIDIPATVDISSQNAFSVNIEDYYGNPLGGHQLNVSSQGGGSVAPPSGTTNEYGVASGFIFTAPPDSGKVSIIVEDADPGYGGITLSKTVEVK